MESCHRPREPSWDRVINQAMRATSIEELHLVNMLLVREIETQEDGPGNRAHIIARLRDALKFVINALGN